MMTHSPAFAIELYNKRPHLEEVVREIGLLPDEAVFIGIAEDEKPVLFCVHENEAIHRSSHTMVWDRIVGQGLRLIKVMIEYILRFKSQKKYRTEFVILSNNTREWLKLAENELGVWSKNECIGVVPFWDKVADQVVFALSGWCVAGRGTKSPVLVFIDGFENVLKMGDGFQHDLQAVMTYGRKRGIFIVASAKSESRPELAKWLDFFHAEIYGQEAIEFFEMAEGRKSIIFWTPSTTI